MDRLTQLQDGIDAVCWITETISVLLFTNVLLDGAHADQQLILCSRKVVHGTIERKYTHSTTKRYINLSKVKL